MSPVASMLEVYILVCMSKTILAAENSVSVYLNDIGPIAAWDDSWFATAYEYDTSIGGECPGAAWYKYRDAARAALKRSQSADLKIDPRHDESQWRSVEVA